MRRAGPRPALWRPGAICIVIALRSTALHAALRMFQHADAPGLTLTARHARANARPDA
jgi:hypothetical protein